MMSQRRSLWSVSLVVLALSMGVSSDSGVANAGAWLTVDIAGLPQDVPGQVVVNGEGEQWELQASTTLRVEPGSYVVTVHPVRTGPATSYGADDSQRVEVPVNETARVNAGYRVTIPDTTKIVPDPANPPIASVGADQVTLVAGAYANGLQAGDAIVVAEGPKTPNGLVRKVLSLRRTGDTIVATTMPVSLFEAVPNLVLRFEQAKISGFLPLEVEGPGMLGRGGRDSGAPSVELNKTLLEKTHGPRKSSVRVEATVDDFHFSVDGDIDVHGGWDPYVEAEVTPKLEYESTVRVTASGTVSGKERGEVDLKGLGEPVEKICKKLVGRLPKIGPISLGCGMRGIVEGEASVKGGISLSRELNGDHSFPLTWRTWESPDASIEGWPPESDPDSEVAVFGEGSVTGKAGLEFSFGGGDWWGKKELVLALDVFYGVEAKADIQKMQVTSGPFFEANLDLRLDLPFEKLDGTAHLLSYESEIPPLSKIGIDGRELLPSEDTVVAYTDSVGIHALRPTTGEVETVAEWPAGSGGLVWEEWADGAGGAPEGPIVLSADGRFLVGKYLPSHFGFPQRMFIWDSVTNTSRSSADRVGSAPSGEDVDDDFTFLDDDTVVGLEITEAGDTRLYFVELSSGQVRHSALTARSALTGLVGPGPEPATLVALEETPNFEDLPEPIPPTDLVWLDLKGRELRRVRLHDTSRIGEMALSPDGTHLAAIALDRERHVGASPEDLLIVDLRTGSVTNAGNYSGHQSADLIRLRSLRWADDSTVMVQGYDDEVTAEPTTAMWRNGRWQTVDTDKQVKAMAFGGQIQVLQWEEELFVLYERPYAEPFNLYTEPLQSDTPVSDGVVEVWFPQQLEPGLYFGAEKSVGGPSRRTLPEDLVLPGEGSGATADTDRDTPWTAATRCSSNAPTRMESDSSRKAFRTVVRQGTRTQTWQLGAYPDPQTADRAYAELYDAIDRCSTGAQSYRHPRADLGADEAFVKTFNSPAGDYGEVADGHTAYAVARVDNIVVVFELDERQVPIRDPRAPDDPAATQMRHFLTGLCDKNWWCPA